MKHQQFLQGREKPHSIIYSNICLVPARYQTLFLRAGDSVMSKIDENLTLMDLMLPI